MIISFSVVSFLEVHLDMLDIFPAAALPSLRRHSVAASLATAQISRGFSLLIVICGESVVHNVPAPLTQIF